MVLPKLDYCSCGWDPLSITLLDKLESIQGFAAKLCMKRWSAFSSLVISDLNWPTLHSRRSRQKVLLCRRIIRNESIISPSSYFSVPAHPNPRTHLPHTLHVPFARTVSFQSSFFVSVCNLWNSLPEEVSLYHLLAHLRLPCCCYHHSVYDVLLSIFLCFYLVLCTHVVH